MMSSAKLEADPYHRVLLLGPAKIGKTACCVATSPGPVCVLLCEESSALRGARRLSPKHFDYELISSDEKMWEAVKEARNGAKAGKYKTIVVDPISYFAAHIEKILRDSTDNDARRWSPEYNNRLDHLIEQLFRIPAHVIVVSHYMETGGMIEGQLEKTGDGIMPLLAGKARVLIPAKFPDVVWMDYLSPKKDAKQAWDGPPYNGRVLVTGPKGVWGPGCRSTHGTQTIPADIKKLFALFDADAGGSNGGKQHK